jgi:hypothetical protein
LREDYPSAAEKIESLTHSEQARWKEAQKRECSKLAASDRPTAARASALAAR